MEICYQKEIKLFSPKIKEITNKNTTQMRTKNNTNQQKIPTHNRNNENCDIADKMEYEVLPHKLLLLPRNLKNPVICLEMLAKKPRSHEKTRKGNYTLLTHNERNEE